LRYGQVSATQALGPVRSMTTWQSTDTARFEPEFLSLFKG
jgi:hypothetical protein